MERVTRQRQLAHLLSHLSVSAFWSIEIGEQDGIRRLTARRRYCVRQARIDRHPGARRAFGRIVDDPHNLDWHAEAAETCDLGKIAVTGKQDADLAFGCTAAEKLGTFLPSKPIEFQRTLQECRRETRFLLKTLGREVIEIALDWRVLELDEAFAQAALEVPIYRSDGDSDVAGKPPLRYTGVILDGRE